MAPTFSSGLTSYLMNRTNYRILIGSIPLGIVLVRIVFWDHLNERFDETAVTLIILSLLFLLIPIENIKSLKAGGVEIELHPPQIKGAINSLNLSITDNKKIEEYINSISSPEIKSLSGSKVLWIDDKPNSILGERRLFRAFGIEITAASSLEQIKKIVKEDNDFDLIISDIQWRDKKNPNHVHYGGIEAIKFLRNELKDKVINSTHVIFYTAYTKSQIDTINRQTNFMEIDNHSINHTILNLLKVSIEKISSSRENPIVVNSRKKPT